MRLAEPLTNSGMRNLACQKVSSARPTVSVSKRPFSARSVSEIVWLGASCASPRTVMSLPSSTAASAVGSLILTKDGGRVAVGRGVAAALGGKTAVGSGVGAREERSRVAGRVVGTAVGDSVGNCATAACVGMPTLFGLLPLQLVNSHISKHKKPHK